MDDSWIRRQDQQSLDSAGLKASTARQEAKSPGHPEPNEHSKDGSPATGVEDEDAARGKRLHELLAKLEAVLRAEHQVLVEAAAGALTTLARQKMALLAAIEQSWGALSSAGGRAWLEGDRAAIEALARCRGLNHINGTLITLRSRQVAQELAALGVSSPAAEPAEAQVAMPGPMACQAGADHATVHGVPGWPAAPPSPSASQEERPPGHNIQHLA